MSKIIAAIDQGTTSTRCILFNREGRIVSAAQKEHTQILPQPGWVEHDPMQLLDDIYEVFAKALRNVAFSPLEIAALGITNQRETTVVWNRRTGKPYANAIVWQDTRTAQLCEKLSRLKGGQDRFRQKTGLPISVYFSGIKLRWLFENVHGLIEEAKNGNLLFGTIDSWLIWNLTGGMAGGRHCTDVTNASRTMLMNLKTLDWDQEILDELGIPKSILPAILPSAGYFGEFRFENVSIPITAVLGDQQAALFGQTCFSPGEAKNTYGTGCFLLMNTGTEPVQSQNGLLTTVGFKVGAEDAVYCLEGSVAIAGSLVQWMRDNLGMIQSSDEIESLAREVEDNGDVYIVPAFSGLFAPYWRSDARGLIAGLTRFSNRGHIARAVLEATAYQTFEVVEAMERDSGVGLKTLKVDGGMTVNELLMQFQSDILNKPLVRPMVRETTALGAAYAAGLTIGYWQSMEELREKWAVERSWNPAMGNITRSKNVAKWKKAVKMSFNWIEDAV